MSQAMPYYPPSTFELLSIEEKIEYVEANLDQIVSEIIEDETIPLWHREILVEVFTNFRSQIEGGITWEEYELKQAKS